MQLVRETVLQRGRQLDILQADLQKTPSIDVNELKSKLQRLLKEKKLEGARQIRQDQYLYSLHIQKIAAIEDMKQFLALSRELFSNFSKKSLPEDKKVQRDSQAKEYILNGVNLYVQFFRQVGHNFKAAEILNIYEKRLCQKDVLFPTLMTWFVEWTRKHYLQKLKTAVLEVSGMIEELEPRQSKNSNLVHRAPSISRLKPQGQRMIRSDTIASIAPIEQEDEKIVINKQLFYGAYQLEMLEIYKNLNGVIGDLDNSYLKFMKRSDSRKQISKNMQKVVETIINSVHPFTKKTIDQYLTYYRLAHPQFSIRVQNIQMEKQNQKVKARRTTSPRKDRPQMESPDRFVSPIKLLSSLSQAKLYEQRPVMLSNLQSASEVQSQELTKIQKSRQLFSKKMIEIRLPSILQRNHSTVPDIVEDEPKKQSSYMIVQKYARNRSFNLRESQIDRPLLELMKTEEKKMKGNLRYSSLNYKQFTDSQRFGLGKPIKSTRLEDMLSQVPQQPEANHSVFTLPRLSKS